MQARETTTSNGNRLLQSDLCCSRCTLPFPWGLSI